MTKGYNRYFIAAIPPSPLVDQALTLKHHFREHYHSKASLDSPPHITLHMPFEWKSEKENELVSSLKKLSSLLTPVTIELRNFGCFAPRVIFIHVVPSKELVAFQLYVRQFCKNRLKLFNADYKDLPFHPHVTLAFRDLKKSMFLKAWGEFQDKTLEGEFLVSRIYLLRHEEKKWRVLQEFPLAD